MRIFPSIRVRVPQRAEQLSHSASDRRVLSAAISTLRSATLSTLRSATLSVVFGRRKWCVLPLFGALGCVPPGDGVAPPFERLYFPVALALSGDHAHLAVIGSDFDLQYNQGTIHSLDLARVRSLLPRVCSRDADCGGGQRCDDAPADVNGGRPTYFCVDVEGSEAGDPCPKVGFKPRYVLAIAPGACAPWPLERADAPEESLISDAVQIAAFATDALLLERPNGAPRGARERLFVPVRGDSSLHWLDFEQGRFECGQTSPRGSCSDDFAVRRNPSLLANLDPPEVLEVPPDPYEVAASPDGRLLAVTHQSSQRVSAFEHNWEQGPTLVSVAVGLPGNPVGIAALPFRQDVGGSGSDAAPGFLSTFRDWAEVHVLRFVEGAAREPDASAASLTAGSALVDVARVPLTINTTGVHSRGIVVDGFHRDRALALCAADDSSCVSAAERIPLDIYIANRAPNSLLLGRTSSLTDPGGPSDVPAFYGSIPLSAGPSGVFLGHVVSSSGELVRRIFVVCFDSALIYVIDPEAHAVESVLFTGQGPASLAFESSDEGTAGPGAIAYVAHFTDSYVSVMSLDQRFPETYGATLATLGTPTPPRAAK